MNNKLVGRPEVQPLKKGIYLVVDAQQNTLNFKDPENPAVLKKEVLIFDNKKGIDTHFKDDYDKPLEDTFKAERLYSSFAKLPFNFCKIPSIVYESNTCKLVECLDNWKELVTTSFNEDLHNEITKVLENMIVVRFETGGGDLLLKTSLESIKDNTNVINAIIKNRDFRVKLVIDETLLDDNIFKIKDISVTKIVGTCYNAQDDVLNIVNEKFLIYQDKTTFKLDFNIYGQLQNVFGRIK